MSATLQKSCAKSARTMRNRLRGFLPIYKEAGVHWLDAMDMLRISLEFDTGIRFNSVNIISNCFPYLHKSAEGILTVAYGQQVHDLPLLKHSDSVYTCKARFGELRKNHHQDGILIDTRKYEHITKDQLTEALKSFEASDTQMKLWKEYRTRTVLHELQAIKAEDKLEAPPKRSLYFEGRSARQVKFPQRRTGDL
ncbi:hypothetical protein HDE_05634 [Halotydeus destructor]|nr:hypothetical protein HDE_05634 [Halotydeus destructor]